MTIEPHYTMYQSLIDQYCASLRAYKQTGNLQYKINAHEAEVKLEMMELHAYDRVAGFWCNRAAWGIQPKRIV